MLRLYLYARARLTTISCTRDRGCSKHPAFPAPSCLGQNGWQSPGETRRGKAEVRLVHSVAPYLRVIVRLVRNCALGGRSSIPETSVIEPDAAAYWIPRLRVRRRGVWLEIRVRCIASPRITPAPPPLTLY
jgi:hypothetical protein